jgi:5-methylcytosine-specific restriction endonuclease McrA
VQFTATDEYVRLVDEAKALLSHVVPNATLDDIQLRAMRAFVAELKKRKYAANVPSMPAAGAREEHPCSPERPEHPRQRGFTRHIPASVRRAVATLDDERCTYVDNAGRRCAETHCLEFHHLAPFARGGEHTPSNLTLRCRAHNAMAAEEDFGREHMGRKRIATHEPSSR